MPPVLPVTPIPVITGIGLVTPLGRSAQTTFDALLAGRSITTHARLEPNHLAKRPRVISLAIEAADEAIALADWNADREDVAVVACTSKGSVESWINTGEPGRPAPVRAETARLSYGLSDLSADLAHHIGSTGPRLCLSAACASGLHGLIRAAMMIQSGEAQRVLVVATEASVHPLFLASFERLGVLTRGLCRPLDQHRDGFLMSEASAAVCLEAATSHNQSRAIAVIDRYALGGDATRITGSDADAAVLRRLLQKVIAGENIDLIHAHGTATVSNDSAELAALEFVNSADACRSGPQTPGRDGPALYSHKAALGHSLGASGLVAVVINCVCHRTGQVPGNIHTTAPLPSETLRINRGRTERRIYRSLIHAAGFGGPTAVLSLRTV